MAVYGAQAAADQDEGALGQAGSICEYGSLNKAFAMGGRGGGEYPHEYAAGIQFASPGPTSRPSFLLKASPPASVTKFAAYLYMFS